MPFSGLRRLVTIPATDFAGRVTERTTSSHLWADQSGSEPPSAPDEPRNHKTTSGIGWTPTSGRGYGQRDVWIRISVPCLRIFGRGRHHGSSVPISATDATKAPQLVELGRDCCHCALIGSDCLNRHVLL